MAAAPVNGTLPYVPGSSLHRLCNRAVARSVSSLHTWQCPIGTTHTSLCGGVHPGSCVRTFPFPLVPRGFMGLLVPWGPVGFLSPEELVGSSDPCGGFRSPVALGGGHEPPLVGHLCRSGSAKAPCGFLAVLFRATVCQLSLRSGPQSRGPPAGRTSVPPRRWPDTGTSSVHVLQCIFVVYATRLDCCMCQQGRSCPRRAPPCCWDDVYGRILISRACSVHIYRKHAHMVMVCHTCIHS